MDISKLINFFNKFSSTDQPAGSTLQKLRTQIYSDNEKITSLNNAINVNLASTATGTNADYEVVPAIDTGNSNKRILEVNIYGTDSTVPTGNITTFYLDVNHAAYTPIGTISYSIPNSIDQTTPGTTDSVTVKASAGVGSLTETAPTTDTASSGLNGRLQRIAQRITSFIGLFASPSTYRNTAVTNTAVAVKASSGDVVGYLLYNPNSTDVWVKFCDLASGSVSVGSTAVVFSLFVPGNSQVVEPYNGASQFTFATAISAYSVTGAADNNSTAPISAVTINIQYK